MNLESVCLVCLVALFVLFLRHYQHARSYAAFIRPLSVFYLLLFLWMFYNWTIYHALRSYSHSIYMWLLPLDLCIASWVHPVLYYYIYRLLSPSLPTTRQLIRHSFYPALATTCMLYFIFQSPKARELSFLSDCFDRPPLVCLLRIGLCLQTIIYCLLIRQLMRSLRPQQFQLSIQGTRINVRWIWVFIIPGMMSVVGHGLFCFLHQSSILHLQVRIILFCAWVLWLLSQSISITGYPTLVPFINPNSKVKMDKKISSSEASRIMKQLREVVESEKLYLNPKCSLDLLASKVGISRNDLSHILNHYGENGHADFIHNYRIQHSLEQIHQQAYHHHTIETIGLISGFASSATFNREFKKRQGVLPGEYIRAHRKGDQTSPNLRQVGQALHRRGTAK